MVQPSLSSKSAFYVALLLLLSHSNLVQGKKDGGSSNNPACPAGSGVEGNGKCKKCGSGEFSPGGSALCATCPSGSNSDNGASSCTTCPVDTYDDMSKGNSGKADRHRKLLDGASAADKNKGLMGTACKSCKKGSNTGGQDGQISCESCDPGYGWDKDTCKGCKKDEISAAGYHAICISAPPPPPTYPPPPRNNGQTPKPKAGRNLMMRESTAAAADDVAGANPYAELYSTDGSILEGFKTAVTHAQAVALCTLRGATLLQMDTEVGLLEGSMVLVSLEEGSVWMAGVPTANPDREDSGAADCAAFRYDAPCRLPCSNLLPYVCRRESDV